MLYNRPVPGNKDARKQFLNTHGEQLWSDAIRAKVLDDIDLKVFMKVAHALFDEAYTTAPSGAAIWDISEGEQEQKKERKETHFTNTQIR